MKKSKWLAALLVSVFALTGCGSKNDKNASEVLDKARKQMNELSNYSMKMEMKMGIKAEGMTMEIPVVVDAKIDAKSKTGKMTTTASVFEGQPHKNSQGEMNHPAAEQTGYHKVCYL